MVRWPNLLMTGIGVISIWYFQIFHFTHGQSIHVDFSGILLLSLALIMIMGAGYIVNDIFDVEIDMINKPSKISIGKYYTTKEGWYSYFILNFIGIAISIYAAYTYRKTSLLLFLPIGISMLYIYSKWLKKRAPWGNILISALCALVLWLPAFGEWDLVIGNTILFNNFFACSLVGGFCMLMRELVKSQEDFNGDKLHDIRTLPVILGMDTVRKILIVLNLIIISFITCILFYFDVPMLSTLVIFILLVLPLLALHLIFTLKILSTRYTEQSKIVKLIMAAGMMILPWL